MPMTWTVQGYVMKLFGGPIDWKSRKQSTVATSTTEAELLAPSRAAQETYWRKRLFNAVDFELDHDIHISSSDNKRTVDSIKNVGTKWVRHTARSYRFGPPSPIRAPGTRYIRNTSLLPFYQVMALFALEPLQVSCITMSSS